MAVHFYPGLLQIRKEQAKENRTFELCQFNTLGHCFIIKMGK